MFFSEGQSCPVCQKPFQKEDDVVVCPVCGAPHHRACYLETGHCHFESTHGTADQWSREAASKTPKTEHPTTRRCPHCGFDNPAFAEFCGHCGRPVETEASSEPDEPQTASTPFGGIPFPGGTFREFTYAPFRATVQDTGGVDPQTEIGGEKATDVARVVGRNPRYYMPTFAKFEQTGKTVKWNWAAFIFAPFWLLYRKNYVVGALTLLFSLLQQTLINYIEIVKLDLLSTDGSYAEMMQYIQSCMEDPTLHRYLSLISVLTLVSFAVHILFGLFGNAIYEHSCLAKIRTAKEKFGDGYGDMLPVVGGVSAGLALISYSAWYFLPLVIKVLLM